MDITHNPFWGVNLDFICFRYTIEYKTIKESIDKRDKNSYLRSFVRLYIFLVIIFYTMKLLTTCLLPFFTLNQSTNTFRDFYIVSCDKYKNCILIIFYLFSSLPNK